MILNECSFSKVLGVQSQQLRLSAKELANFFSAASEYQGGVPGLNLVDPLSQRVGTLNHDNRMANDTSRKNLVKR
jgi:hypothetical protein